MGAVAAQQTKRLAPLTDDLVLLECGRGSLCFAILVARLATPLATPPSAPKTRCSFPARSASSSLFMNMSHAEAQRLAQRIAGFGAPGRWLWDGLDQAQLDAALTETRLDAPLASLANRSVLLRTPSQLTAALALIELDGVARSIVFCPPDLDEVHLQAVIQDAQIDAVVGTAPDAATAAIFCVNLGPPRPCPLHPLGKTDTEWVMFTSGTTGRPKMVAHTLEGLTGAITPSAVEGEFNIFIPEERITPEALSSVAALAELVSPLLLAA